MKDQIEKINKWVVIAIMLFIGRNIAIGKLNPQICVNKVDSIVIKRAISFGTNPECCVSREHFDSIFNAGMLYQKSHPKMYMYSKIVLNKEKDYTLFLKILNSLNPLKPEYVKVLPKEVRLTVKKPYNSLTQLMRNETNDPIPTNTKYIIYFNDGNTCEIFASNFYVDYENWRYFNNMYLRELCFWFYEKENLK